jgi:hypothetical protein
MTSLELLLADVDARWKHPQGTKIRLNVIGSAALLLQTNYNRGTKDGDVLETAELAGDTKARLIALAGQQTALHRRHRMYLDMVPNGVPFLPHAPLYHAVVSLSGLVHFEVFALDVVDVVVSKFKRYHANDQADVAAMSDGRHVPHERLIERFRSAVDVFAGDARADKLPIYVKNLHQAERDYFDVPETEIELPEWV